eukprot:2168599-Alexandrium_andersonii.AAC.1
MRLQGARRSRCRADRPWPRDAEQGRGGVPCLVQRQALEGRGLHAAAPGLGRAGPPGGYE